MPHPYSLACVFPSKGQAIKTFQVLRDLIYREKTNELSVYRLYHQRQWYVIVVGDQPGPDLHRRVHELLHQHKGRGASLPDGLIEQLRKRRVQQLQGGKTWVEYRAKQPWE